MQSLTLPTPIWTTPLTPVSDHIRNYVINTNPVGSNATMYCSDKEPNKVYVFRGGFLQSVAVIPAELYSSNPANDMRQTTINSESMDQPTLQTSINIPTVSYINLVVQQVVPVKPQVISVVPIKAANYLSKSEKIQNKKKSAENASSLQLVPRHPCAIMPAMRLETEREIQQRKRHKEGVYKTVLCLPFKETGFCKFGVNCCFAHGEEELRAPSQKKEPETSKPLTVLPRPVRGGPKNSTSGRSDRSNDTFQSYSCFDSSDTSTNFGSLPSSYTTRSMFLNSEEDGEKVQNCEKRVYAKSFPSCVRQIRRELSPDGADDNNLSSEPIEENPDLLELVEQM
ncbi:unnamed protein product [Enterobius vermicularis]|uniref:C3H1-type domain-containing protein n=1 Tax=Enterobius vermicularis TaxID=51028 RepID=A0A0N4V2H5_ENTVE|nr:unnamed protein product [Enterobius vermicularis]